MKNLEKTLVTIFIAFVLGYFIGSASGKSRVNDSLRDDLRFSQSQIESLESEIESYKAEINQLEDEVDYYRLQAFDSETQADKAYDNGRWEAYGLVSQGLDEAISKGWITPEHADFVYEYGW